jgi:hypothetical protein
MPSLEFVWDSRNLAFFRGNASEKALSRALRLAGNQAFKVMAEQSESHVIGRKLIDRARVTGGLDLIFPGSKEAIASLQWTERVSGEVMPLSRFPAIATAQGVRVRVNATSGFKLLPSAFMRRLSTGHLGVFQRTGTFGRRGNPKLERIRELWTTRISDAMSDVGAVDKVQTKAMERFGAVFEKNLERELAKMKRKGDA